MTERDEFRWTVTAGGRLASINYSYVQQGTFDRAVARECRGLAFDAVTGEIAARPFHKFFNWGERPDEDAALDWTAGHTVIEKMDGTLMFPAMLSCGEVIWCTRAGRTEMAEALQAMLPGHVWEMCARLTEVRGVRCTPCFEHTSPGNRIVLRYDRPQLTLLAIREVESGRYLTGPEVTRATDEAGFCDYHDPDVRLADGVLGFQRVRASAVTEFIESVWARTGEEGVVIAFDDGHRVKVKAAEYVRLHHVRSYMDAEHAVLRLVIDGAEDTLCQVVSPEAVAAVTAYADEVRQVLRNWGRYVAQNVRDIMAYSAGRDDFAREWVSREGIAMVRAAGFKAYSAQERGGDPASAAEDCLRHIIARKCGRRRKVVEEVRPDLDLPEWRNPMFELDAS